jgi:hypothetical protein
MTQQHTPNYETCLTHGEVETTTGIVNGELMDLCPLCVGADTQEVQPMSNQPNYETCIIHGEVETTTGIVNGELIDLCPICESESEAQAHAALKLAGEG